MAFSGVLGLVRTDRHSTTLWFYSSINENHVSRPFVFPHRNVQVPPHHRPIPHRQSACASQGRRGQGRLRPPIISNYEIAEYFAAQGAQTHGLNPGGGFDFPFGRVKLTLAFHSSSVHAGLNPIYLGSPCGLLIRADGRTLYHAGDTALFLDMQLIGRLGLDVAMVPIGDNFTMGFEDAAAALDLLNPRVAIPMHYNTWPLIAVDPERFVEAAARTNHTVQVLKPGESLVV